MAVINQEDNGEQKRAQTEGLTEFMRTQIDAMMINHVKHLRFEYNKDCFDHYRKAFIDGVKVGIEIGKSLDEDY
jgi:hypothetical protein